MFGSPFGADKIDFRRIKVSLSCLIALGLIDFDFRIDSILKLGLVAFVFTMKFVVQLTIT